MNFEHALCLDRIDIESVRSGGGAGAKLERASAVRVQMIAETLDVVDGEVRTPIGNQEIEIRLTAQNPVWNGMGSESDALQERLGNVSNAKPVCQSPRFLEEELHADAIAFQAQRQVCFKRRREQGIGAILASAIVEVDRQSAGIEPPQDAQPIRLFVALEAKESGSGIERETGDDGLFQLR